jgi:hypothetical protein
MVGLDWNAVGARLEGADAETRARVMDLLGAIEAGAVKASAERGAESEG